MRERAEPARVISLPGLEPFTPDLTRTLITAIEAKGPEYRPRTHHFNDDGTPKYTNRLIFEPSPYLLQHAHNPVNWYPWGDEAFERARAEGKPVLLSVGYATCHWCHVMEEESFEDEEIARLINEHYIAIKVDREQRPDVADLDRQAAAAPGRGHHVIPEGSLTRRRIDLCDEVILCDGFPRPGHDHRERRRPAIVLLLRVERHVRDFGLSWQAPALGQDPGRLRRRAGSQRAYEQQGAQRTESSHGGATWRGTA